jgi:hypothetical protein
MPTAVPNLSQHKEPLMCPRTEIFETKVYRPKKKKDVLCRLTYEVTPFRDDLMRWFLLGIEELE